MRGDRYALDKQPRSVLETITPRFMRCLGPSPVGGIDFVLHNGVRSAALVDSTVGMIAS